MAPQLIEVAPKTSLFSAPRCSNCNDTQRANGTQEKCLECIHNQTATPIVTDEQIMLLICEHTGDRINLRIAEIYEQVELVRAAMRLQGQGIFTQVSNLLAQRR